MIEICALCNGYTKIILLGFINNFSLIKYCVDKDVRWLTQMKFTLYTIFKFLIVAAIVVGFTTTYATSAYDVVNSNLDQAQVLRFPPPIKLTATT